ATERRTLQTQDRGAGVRPHHSTVTFHQVFLLAVELIDRLAHLVVDQLGDLGVDPLAANALRGHPIEQVTLPRGGRLIERVERVQMGPVRGRVLGQYGERFDGKRMGVRRPVHGARSQREASVAWSLWMPMPTYSATSNA